MTVSFRAPALLLATLLLALVAGADVSRAQTLDLSPGFASLMQAAPETGQAIEPEHEGDTPGSTVVRTTTGMLYWQQGIAPSWTDGNQRLTVDASGVVVRWTGVALSPPSPEPRPVVASGPAVGIWDKMADCESNGNWAADTGNGYLGGLQFRLGDWHTAGGVGRPEQASRAEQIRVAQNWQQMVGWGAWPACARRYGLR